MEKYECGKPLNDKTNEAPNKKWVLDFNEGNLILREQGPADSTLGILETGLCYTESLAKQVNGMIADPYTFVGEIGRILNSLMISGDDRIAEKDKVFAPLLGVGKLELELKALKDILKKEEEDIR